MLRSAGSASALRASSPGTLKTGAPTAASQGLSAAPLPVADPCAQVCANPGAGASVHPAGHGQAACEPWSFDSGLSGVSGEDFADAAGDEVLRAVGSRQLRGGARSRTAVLPTACCPRAGRREGSFGGRTRGSPRDCAELEGPVENPPSGRVADRAQWSEDVCHVAVGPSPPALVPLLAFRKRRTLRAQQAVLALLGKMPPEAPTPCGFCDSVRPPRRTAAAILLPFAICGRGPYPLHVLLLANREMVCLRCVGENFMDTQENFNLLLGIDAPPSLAGTEMSPPPVPAAPDEICSTALAVSGGVQYKCAQRLPG